MSLKALFSHWQADPSIGGNIVTWHTTPAKVAQFESLPADMHPDLKSALERSGIFALYKHQSSVWRHSHERTNLVISTGTASGKSLCYNLPVLDNLLRESDTRALYLFPTKALAQDQTSALNRLFSFIHQRREGSLNQQPSGNSSIERSYPTLSAAIYDGDTPKSIRSNLRTTAQIILSNPDMLHTGILPHHTAWAEFFQHLRYVIIDEIHVFRGVFGSHVANVLRRLQRVCTFYGSKPGYILTSATIGNPAELAEKLIGHPVVLIDDDGAARGPQHFLVYNPPVVDRQIGLRRSAAHETVRLADDLLAYNVQAILFARSRRSVEVVLTYLRESVSSWAHTSKKGDKEALPAKEMIRGYRSGYLPRQRREIEAGLRNGTVCAVVATNALELGIDIGGMEAALMIGYPGSIAATWQQAGRAGRGQEDSLAVLISTAAPLDQFLAQNTDYLFARNPEHALINPDNLLLLLDHLRCAAFELPFQTDDTFGNLDPDLLTDFLKILQSEGVLHRSGNRFFWMADQYPAQGISLRSIVADEVILQVLNHDSVSVIGKIDFASATRMVHPGAVYLHEGISHIVTDLDLTGHIATLKSELTDYYTEPVQESTIQLIDLQDESAVTGGFKAYGEILVTTSTTGFRKIKWFTHENIGAGQLDLPPSELHTTGYWFAINDQIIERLRDSGLWRNDSIDYGPNWSIQRDRARKRDNFLCQVCGRSEGRRSHDVHHIQPFRSCLDSEGRISYQIANRLDNLITLCSNCHRRAETAVRVRSGLAGLAYICANLAPIFLMCDSRDLGVQTDPQSNLTSGSPTIILYDLVPAGIGFSQRLFEVHADLMQLALEQVANCDCEDGCPSCVGPGGELGMGGKRETLAILLAINANNQE